MDPNIKFLTDAFMAVGAVLSILSIFTKTKLTALIFGVLLFLFHTATSILLFISGSWIVGILWGLFALSWIIIVLVLANQPS
jgi:hypothetical protein